MFDLQIDADQDLQIQLNISGVAADGIATTDTLCIEMFTVNRRTYKRDFRLSLTPEGACRLLHYLQSVSIVKNHPTSVRTRFIEVDPEHGLPAEAVKAILEQPAAVAQILSSNISAVAQFVESQVEARDIVALAYRRAQLAKMQAMIDDPDVFSATQDQWGYRGPEAVWQRFFEENPWIFGQGLNLLAFGPVDAAKLEQVTTGQSVVERGKRTDALLATCGAVRSLCFVEIKHHSTELVASRPYRPEVWSPSDELVGAVAQAQKTVHKAMHTIGHKLVPVGEDGTPLGQSFFNYVPRSYVVIGNSRQFIGEHGLNEQRFSSFELFRRHLQTPEVVTFDELLTRAELALSSGGVA